MTKHTFTYKTDRSEFDETIPFDVSSTCDEELSLDGILEVFQLHLKSCGYVLPDGYSVGLVQK